MRNLDYQHFVVNYSKDDRDDVPHFLLSISYEADAETPVSPSARLIIAPQVLCWYLSTYCNYEIQRFVPVEINVINKITFGSNVLKFCFFTSMASTGSTMLVVSGAMGTYFVTGHFCFSNELFKHDAMNNLKQFGEIDRLYIDATLYNVKADLKTIDNICYTIASIIFDTPKSQKVIIMSKPGLEFILVRVMLIMEEKKHLELCHVGTHIYELIEQMGYGRLFTNCVKKGAEAKVYVDANLTEIRRNFGVFHDFVMIRLIPRQIWDADVKSHIKGKHSHVFMILPHSTKEQCDRLISKLNPKAYFQILSKPPVEKYLYPHQSNRRVSPCDLQMDPYSSISLTQNPKVRINQVSGLKNKQSSTKSRNVRKKTLSTKSILQKIPGSTINGIRSLPSTSKLQSSVNCISKLPTTSKLDSSVDHFNDLPTTSNVISEDDLIKDSIIIASHNLISLPKKLVKIKKGRKDNQIINQPQNALDVSNILMNTVASDQICKNDLICLEPDAINSEANLQEAEEDPLLLYAESLDTKDKSLSESKIVDHSTTKILVKPSSKSDLNIKQVLKTSPINDSCVQTQTKNVNGEQDVSKNKKPDSYRIKVIDKKLLTVPRFIKIKSPNQKIKSKPKEKDMAIISQGGDCARTSVCGRFQIKSRIQKISSKSIDEKSISNISFVKQKCLSLVPNHIQTKIKVQNGNSIDSSKPLFKKISDVSSLIVPSCVEIESTNTNTHSSVPPKEIFTGDKSIPTVVLFSQSDNLTTDENGRYDLKKSHEFTPNVSDSDKPADRNIHDVRLASSTSVKLQTTEDCSLTLSENVALTNKITNIVEPESTKLILKKGQTKYNQPKCAIKDFQIESTHSSTNSGEFDSSIKNGELNKYYTIDESTPMIMDHVQIEPGLQNNLNQSQQPLLISLAGDKHSPLVTRSVPINPTIQSGNLKEVSKPALKKRKVSVLRSLNNSDCVAIESKNLNTQQIARPIKNLTADKSIQINNRTTDVIIKKNLKRSHSGDEITLKACEIQPTDNDAVLKPTTSAICLASGNCLANLSKTTLPTNQRTTVVAIDKFNLKNSETTGKNGKIKLKKCHSVDDITSNVLGKDHIILYENPPPILAENLQIKHTSSNMDAAKNAKILKKIYPTDKHSPIVLYRVQIDHDFQNKPNGNNHSLLLRLGGNKFSSQCSRRIPIKQPIRNKNSKQTPKPLFKIKKSNDPTSQMDCGSVKIEPKLIYQQPSIINENIVLTNQRSAIDTSTIQKRSIEIDSTVTDKKKVQIEPGFQNNTDKCEQPLLINRDGDNCFPLVSSPTLCKPQIRNGYSKKVTQSALKQNNGDPSCQVVSNNIKIDREHLKIYCSPQPKKDETRDELVALGTLINNRMTDENAQPIVKNSHSSDKIAPILSEVKQSSDSFFNENIQIPLNNDANRNDKIHALKKMDPIDESIAMILDCNKIMSGLGNNSETSEQPLLIGPVGNKRSRLVASQMQVKRSCHENSEVDLQLISKRIKFSDPSCQIVSDYVENGFKNLRRNSSPLPKKDETRDESNPLVHTQIDSKMIDENAQQIVQNSESRGKIGPIVSEVRQASDTSTDENNQIPLIHYTNRNDKTHAMKKIDPIDESAAMIFKCDSLVALNTQNDNRITDENPQKILKNIQILSEVKQANVNNKKHSLKKIDPIVTMMILECDKVKTITRNCLVKCQQPFLISLTDDQHSSLVASQTHVKPSIRNEPNSCPQPKKDYTSDKLTPIVTLNTQIESRTTDINNKNDLKKYNSGNELLQKVSESKLNENLPLIFDENIKIKPANPTNYDDKNANHPLKEIDPIDENTSIIVHSMSNSVRDKSISIIITNNQNKNKGINENDNHNLKKCHSGNEIHPKICETQVNKNFCSVNNNSKISEKVNKNLVPVQHEDIQIKPTNPNNFEDINAKHPLMKIVESNSISTIPKKDYLDDIPIPIATGFENRTTNENGKHDVKKCQPGDEIRQKIVKPAFKGIQTEPINLNNNYEHKNANQVMKDNDHIHETMSIVTLNNEIDNNLKKCHSSDEILPQISNHNLPPILDENMQIKSTNCINAEEGKVNHRLKKIDPVDESTSVSTHIKKNSTENESTSLSLDNANENTTTDANIKHDLRKSHPGDEIAINVYKNITIKPTNNNILLDVNKYNNLQVNNCTSINTVINETPTLSDSENDSFNGFIPEDIKRVFPIQNNTFFSQINNKSSILCLINHLPLKKPYKCMLSSLSPKNQPVYLKMIIGKLGLDAFDSRLPTNKASVLDSIEKSPLKVNKVDNIREKKTSCSKLNTRTIIEAHRNKDYILNHNKKATDSTTIKSNSEKIINANEENNSSPYPSNETSADRIYNITHIKNSELNVDEPVEDPKICKEVGRHINDTENLENKKNTKACIFSNIVKGSILDSIDKKTLSNINTKRNGNKWITLRVNKFYNLRKNKTSYGRFGTRNIIEPHRNKDYIVDYKTKTRNKLNANEENNSSLYKKTTVDRKIRRIKNTELNVNEPIDNAKKKQRHKQK